MRDDVLIVLNEREPLKYQMADALEQQLRGKRLIVERLEPAAEIEKIIAVREPKIVVLDYLLGDFATALDVLQNLSVRGSAARAILWTDEPSVHAAVTALKLGAWDYIKIDSPRAVQHVVESIDACLSSARPAATAANDRYVRPQLVHESRSSRVALAQALSAASRGLPVVVLTGPAGCGRSALARYIHSERRRAGRLIELDLDLWTGSAASIFSSPRPVDDPLLSFGSTVVIDHAEFDTGELLEAAQVHIAANGGITPGMLIIGTTDKQTAAAWRRLTGAEVIDIPPLADRFEDLFPILQRLQREAARFERLSVINFGPEIVRFLAALEWPGNIKQFRAAVLEGFSTPLELLDGGEQESHAEQEPENGLTEAEKRLARAITAAKERWERFSQPLPGEYPSPKGAAAALGSAEGRLHVASARLAVGVPQLMEALRTTTKTGH